MRRAQGWSRLWTELRDATTSARLVASYLLTNEQAIQDVYGLYQRPLAAIAHDLALSEGDVLEAADDLAVVSFAHLDPASGWIWVESTTEDRVLKGRTSLHAADVACGQAQAWWRSLEPNPLLLPYEARYGQALHLRAVGVVRRELVVRPKQGTLLANQVSSEGVERKAMAVATQHAQAFAGWWAEYPMKVGKGAAREQWMKLRPAFPDVMAGLFRWKRSQKWADDFIILPAAWLKERRWEDDPPRAVGGRTLDLVKSLRADGGLFDGEEG